MLKTLGIVKGALLTEKQCGHLARRLNGMSVLEWVVRQMTDCELLSGVIVLADEGAAGEQVRRLAPFDVPVFAPPAKDTLSLLQQTFEHFSADACVFIGADYPFLDPTLIDQLILSAEKVPDCHYAAYRFTNEIFSVGRPYGLFPEWYQRDSLRKIAGRVTDPIYRQLPGTYYLDNRNRYKVKLLSAPAELDQQEQLRFTFNNEADWDDILDLSDALDMEAFDSRKVGGLLKPRYAEMAFAE
ncbi:MAG: NTP transferase domain-containing protein [Planctomycetaceae bacterium]|jgi:spore coat polysaccharide biosynthesis protein SpsF (cytidylyltransferase family)|nr:NTP transferase domain-containing protein [Planctomycetaceae bacterium]